MKYARNVSFFFHSHNKTHTINEWFVWKLTACHIIQTRLYVIIPPTENSFQSNVVCSVDKENRSKQKKAILYTHRQSVGGGEGETEKKKLCMNWLRQCWLKLCCKQKKTYVLKLEWAPYLIFENIFHVFITLFSIFVAYVFCTAEEE